MIRVRQALNHDDLLLLLPMLATIYQIWSTPKIQDDVVALEIFQIAEEVKAHLLVAKQETVSKLSCSHNFVWHLIPENYLI
jgi:hypothetical protein